MPTISDTAICLRRWDFSETSQTVSLFCRAHGLLRGLAKGSKRPRSTFSGGFDVLTRGAIVAIVKPGRDLATLTEWKLEAVHRWLHLDLAANKAAFWMADVTSRLLAEDDPHPDLFDAFAGTLEALASRPAVPAALLVYQWRLLVETGFGPELGTDAASGRPIDESLDVLGFAPAHGGVLEEAEGPDRWKVRRETIDLLRGVAGEGAVPAGADPEAIERANRLLAHTAREVIGRELPTMDWAFGGSDPVR